MTNFFKIEILLLIVVLLFACNSNTVYKQYIKVKNGIWKKENIASFEFIAKDTISYNNLYIRVRNKGNYPYSNLYLFVKILGPDNNFTIDTVNCILADDRGRWKGKGVGDLWDYKQPYLGGVKFAHKGKYTISFEQAMRVKNGLKGIADIGLSIEKVKK